MAIPNTESAVCSVKPEGSTSTNLNGTVKLDSAVTEISCRRFYAESDPYVRDTRVKPDWDRVLDRIREMQAEAERRRQELRDHLELGRRAGALPGWLREGIELEPPAPPDNPEAGEHQAVEPPVYTQPPLEPPPRLLGAWR